MYLRIIGAGFSENIFNEIEALTNYGILYLRKVEYNEENKIISIPIERYKIEATKKKKLGTTTSYKYDKNIRIPSTIVIRNVTDCQIKNNCDDPSISQILILFGLRVKTKDNEIYIGSAEENRGQTCYSIKLRFEEIDIEISDQN